MAKNDAKEPGVVLRMFIDRYKLNPSRLAASVKLSQSTIRQITLSKMKISVPVALRLAKFFGNSVEFWTTLQMEYDLQEAVKDKRLASINKSIGKVQKPLAEKSSPARKTAVAEKKGKKIKAAPKKRKIKRK